MRRRALHVGICGGFLLAATLAGVEGGPAPSHDTAPVTVAAADVAVSGPDLDRRPPNTTSTRVEVPRPSRSLTRPRSVPPARSVPVAGDGGLLWRIIRCESGGRPDAYNPRSGASGLGQYLRSTWHGYAGYPEARFAPVAVQLERMRADLARIGTRPWVASRACWSR